MAERLFLRLDGDPLYAPETTVPGGTVHRVADLASEYGFTDIDGRHVPAFEID